MGTIRELLATDALIGTEKIRAARLEGGGERRLAAQPAVKRDGATHIDLGEDARRETLVATVDEAQYQRLVNLRLSAKVHTMVHPFFGVFEGRVFSTRYTATDRTHVEATIVLVEEGDRSQNVINTGGESDGLAAAADKVRAIVADVFLGIDVLNDLAPPVAVVVAVAEFTIAWDSFDASIDDVQVLASGPNELAALFGDLAEFAVALGDAIDAAVGEIEEFVISDVPDLLFSAIDLARAVVAEAQALEGVIWTTFHPTRAVLLSQLVFDLLGSVSDVNIDLVLDANPELIDVLAIQAGVPINLPVILEAP